MSAAAQALQLADAGAAEGQQDADRHWHQSFVSALNAAAMRGIADHNAAAAAIAAGAGEAGSQQGDRRRWVAMQTTWAQVTRQGVLGRVACMHSVQKGSGAHYGCVHSAWQPQSSAPSTCVVSIPAVHVCVCVRSFVSSASALRHAEAAATRREQLLQKLHRLTGTQPPAAAATAAGPGMLLEGGAKAGSSVCGSTGSRLGMAAAAGGSRAQVWVCWAAVLAWCNGGCCLLTG